MNNNLRREVLWTIYGSESVRSWELTRDPNPRDWGGLEHLQPEEVAAFLDERSAEIARLREQIGNDGIWGSLVHHSHPVYPGPAAEIGVHLEDLGHAVKASIDGEVADDFVFEGLIVVPGHRLAGLKPSRVSRELRGLTRCPRDIMRIVRAEHENGTGRSLAFTDSMYDGELRVLRDFERVVIRTVIDWTVERDAAHESNIAR